jgi:predicted enzyme related to lactoylglutathione lyase
MTMGSAVVWFEVAGRDLPALSDFYGRLFDWKVDADNPMQYGMVDTRAEGGIPGGIFAAPEEAPPYVTFYVDVPSVGAALETGEKLGGKVLVEPREIDGGATIALLADPEGHPVGLIQQP